MSIHERHDVELRVELGGWIDADLELAALHPLDESPDAALHMGVVFDFFQLVEDFSRNAFLCFGVRAEVEFGLLFRTRKKLECRPVGLQADEHAHSFRRLHRFRELLESAQVEIADETIEGARVAAE